MLWSYETDSASEMIKKHLRPEVDWFFDALKIGIRTRATEVQM